MNNKQDTSSNLNQVVSDQREDLFSRVNLVCALGAGLAGIVTFVSGTGNMAWVFYLAAAALLFALWQNKSTPFKVRASALLAIQLVGGLLALWGFGITAASAGYLVLFAVLTAQLFGTVSGFWSMGLAAVVWITFGLLFQFKVLPDPALFTSSDFTNWLIAGINLFTVVFSLNQSQQILGEIQDYVGMVSRQKRDMQDSQAELTKQTKALDYERYTLHTLLDTVSDRIFYKDRTGRYIRISKAVAAQYGVSPINVIGHDDDDFFAPETVQMIRAKEQQIMNTGQPCLDEVEEEIWKDGRPVSWSITNRMVLRDQEGEIIGWFGTARNITDIKIAQAAAEGAMHAKSAFLANMSHEIRTPMNAIVGMTDLLLDTPLNLQQRDFVETIKNSGDALLTIINDILDYSKIEAGRVELDIHQVNVRELIEACLDVVAAKAAEKGLDLVCVIDPSTPIGFATDSTRIRQILINMLSNAIKFTEHGEVSVTFQATLLEGTENHYEIHFSVNDTGIGIPKERMDRLFKSFSQVDASTTRRFGGTGLGLVISKRLAELMGGTIWVESEMGKGSTFNVTAKAEKIELPQADYLRGSQPKLSGRRILVVDDNPTNRKILTLQTQSWDMLAVNAASAKEALELIRRGERFDLAILDMQMPEMDGLMLADEIHKLPQTRTLPLIMLTSIGWSKSDPRLKEFAAYFNKPIKASMLYNSLMEVLAGEQATQTRRTKSEISTQLDPHMAERWPLDILLAEDNPTNQKLALILLSRLGYKAAVANNGQEAVELLKMKHYDCVLMDVQMPEMDGLEATHAIRETFPADQQPYIVAMTANAMQGDREMCLSAGMNNYISKPIDVKELVARLYEAPSLKGSALAAAAAAAPQAPQVPAPAEVPMPSAASLMSPSPEKPAGVPAAARTVAPVLRPVAPQPQPAPVLKPSAPQTTPVPTLRPAAPHPTPAPLLKPVAVPHPQPVPVLKPALPQTTPTAPVMKPPVPQVQIPGFKPVMPQGAPAAKPVVPQGQPAPVARSVVTAQPVQVPALKPVMPQGQPVPAIRPLPVTGPLQPIAIPQVRTGPLGKPQDVPRPQIQTGPLGQAAAQAVAVAAPVEQTTQLDPAPIRMLREAFGGESDDVLKTLLAEFFSNAPKLIRSLRPALEQGNMPELNRTAHTLKSNGATFGATLFSNLSRDLEYMTKEGRTDGADRLIEQIEQEYTRAKAALEALVKK